MSAGGQAVSTGTSARRRAALAPLLGALVCSLLVAGCSVAFPARGATTQGRDVSNLYALVLIPVVAIFVLVEGLLIWSVIRYRRRDGDEQLPPQVHGNRNLELTWTILPTVLVLVVFVLSMQTLGVVDAKSPNPDLRVDVHGYQWYWVFDYAGSNVTVSGLGKEPELILPTDRSIHVSLVSDNVIHSFYVPVFLFKRDVIPGIANSFDFTIDDPGTYRGQCAEFCGVGHAGMTFTVRAVSGADFDGWLAQQKAAPSATTSPSLESGATTLEVSASTPISFEQSSLQAPADRAFAIHFTNRESGTPHDVAIKDSSGKTLFQGDVITGPAEATYAVTAMAAGSYTFFCAVHPSMTGTLTVR
jgi:cytochrome c oxidase subunit 2